MRKDKNDEFITAYEENGRIKPEPICRKLAHEQGLLHGAIQVYIYRVVENEIEILLQLRSSTKDSYPGYYDISIAGHQCAGDSMLDTLKKEAKEELGLDLDEMNIHHPDYYYRYSDRSSFYGKSFVDEEYESVFLLRMDYLKISSLVLQKQEVDSVKWHKLNSIVENLNSNKGMYCINKESFLIAATAIRKQSGIYG